MQLRYSPTSPYVRKVTVTILELGLSDRVERIPTNPWDADTDLPGDNPLGKVPVLITEDGSTLFDSPVICEYLDSLAGTPKLFPPSGAQRWRALRLQALADGVLDAGVSRFLELNKRAESERSQMWLTRQTAVIERAIDTLEAEVAEGSSAPTIGEITAGCALGYVDFRLPELIWRDSHPRLAQWYSGFAERPAMRETVPQG